MDAHSILFNPGTCHSIACPFKICRTPIGWICIHEPFRNEPHANVGVVVKKPDICFIFRKIWRKKKKKWDKKIENVSEAGVGEFKRRFED